MMGKQASGACDIDEEYGESDARGEPAFTQVPLGEAGERRLAGCRSRLIADEGPCRQACLPPAGEATTEHGDSGEPMAEEPPRHPGAGRLAWSGAVHHQVPIGAKILRSPGNLVVRYPDRARNTLAILTPTLGPPDIQDSDWLVTA
jgi:hypothetical protein